MALQKSFFVGDEASGGDPDTGDGARLASATILRLEAGVWPAENDCDIFEAPTTSSEGEASASSTVKVIGHINSIPLVLVAAARLAIDEFDASGGLTCSRFERGLAGTRSNPGNQSKIRTSTKCAAGGAC